jgi:hypothetical protein
MMTEFLHMCFWLLSILCILALKVNFIVFLTLYQELEWCSQHSDFLWAGQSGVQILVGARDFSLLQNIRTGSGAHHPPVCLVPGFFPEGKVAGA